MKIAIAKEKLAAEKRVAASPETVKKMVALGAEVFVAAGAAAHWLRLDSGQMPGAVGVVGGEHHDQ